MDAVDLETEGIDEHLWAPRTGDAATAEPSNQVNQQAVGRYQAWIKGLQQLEAQLGADSPGLAPESVVPGS